MKPPTSDANRPGSPNAAPPSGSSTRPTGPDPVKSEPAKDGFKDTVKDPVKPGVPKTDAAKLDSAKPELDKPAPVKPAAEVPKSASGLGATGPASPPPGSTGAASPNPASSGPAKTEAPRPDASKTGAFGVNPQPSSRPTSGADGPIIDLKAKRLPDPVTPPMGAASAKTSETKPGDTKAPEPKVADAMSGTKAEPPKSPDVKSSDGKPSGASATPRITPAPAVTPDPTSRGPGFGSVAAAGLLGGVIGAGLLFAVERAGVLGLPDDGRVTALEQRLGTLAPRDALTGLDQRVARNETVLKTVPEAVAQARAALEKANAVQAAPSAASEAAPAAPAAIPADLVARLDGLDQRVAALQEEPGRDQGADARMAATQAAGAGAARLSALSERLKALEGRVEAAPKPAAAPDLAPKLAALQGDVEARTKANSEAAQALNQKLAALQQTLDARVQAATEAVQAATQASQQATDAGKAQAAEAAKAVERQIQAQSEKIAGLDKAVSERAETATVKAALRVVSADRIATAISAGTPYADALASLRNLEPGDPQRLNAVAVFADRGAPTARALAAEFRPIADRIAASRRAAQTRTVAETGDIGTKLMSMAESIVQVRRVDTAAPAANAPAQDPVPKVQDALDRGALAEAAAAFAALPEDVRAQAGEFGTKLKSRAAAGEAAQALLTDAFKGLPAPGAPR